MFSIHAYNKLSRTSMISRLIKMFISQLIYSPDKCNTAKWGKKTIFLYQWDSVAFQSMKILIRYLLQSSIKTNLYISYIDRSMEGAQTQN